MPRRSRLDVAKEQIVAAVQNMHAKTRYRLLTFTDKVTSWNPKPVRPSRRNLRVLTEWTTQLQPHGGTNIANALLQALDPRLPNGTKGRSSMRRGRTSGHDRASGRDGLDNEVDELFLMSDGLPASGPVTEPDKVLKLVREANRYLKIRINTVFTGKGTDAADSLRKLAAQNGGVFVQG